jgi:hypothetical protein
MRQSVTTTHPTSERPIIGDGRARLARSHGRVARTVLHPATVLAALAALMLIAALGHGRAAPARQAVSAPWYFFGAVCMDNAPADCTRVVFDKPMRVTDLSRESYAQPLIFDAAGACLDALPQKFDGQKPYSVEGSHWAEAGCTQRSLSHADQP